MHTIFNCHNVTKHATFYLGQLRMHMTSTVNAGCFKNSFATLRANVNLFKGHVQ
jgi:hypothetical protein